MTAAITRRGFIGAAAAGATLSAASHPAFAAGIGLFVFDPSLAQDVWPLLDQRFGGNAAVELQQDVVRQWREGLGRSVANAGGATALVRWAEASILMGLARENGGTATLHPLAAGVFEVRITGAFAVAAR